MKVRWLLCVSALVACSSSESPGASPGDAATGNVYEAFCTSKCRATKRCAPATDETVCLAGCRKQGTYSANTRADYVQAMVGCHDTAACDKILACPDTAKSSVVATSAAGAFCDSSLRKNAECMFAPSMVDRAACIESVKTLSDASLDGARACEKEPCTNYGGCTYPFMKW